MESTVNTICAWSRRSFNIYQLPLAYIWRTTNLQSALAMTLQLKQSHGTDGPWRWRRYPMTVAVKGDLNSTVLNDLCCLFQSACLQSSYGTEHAASHTHNGLTLWCKCLGLVCMHMQTMSTLRRTSPGVTVQSIPQRIPYSGVLHPRGWHILG